MRVASVRAARRKLVRFPATSLRRSATGCGARRTVLSSAIERTRRKDHQCSSLQHTRCGTRRLGTQCAAWIRRHATRFNLAEAVQIYGETFSSGESRLLQHPQPPQFWKPQQLSRFISGRAESSIWASDDDASKLPGKRRPERRPQSALPDWRTALDPACS